MSRSLLALALAFGSGVGCAAPGAGVRVEPGALVFRYGGGSAQRVQVAGSWDGWNPRDLDRLPSGVFHLRLPVPPGVHHCSMQVDGGTWRAPAGSAATAIPDGWGGESTRVDVPEIRHP